MYGFSDFGSRLVASSLPRLLAESWWLEADSFLGLRLLRL